MASITYKKPKPWDLFLPITNLLLIETYNTIKTFPILAPLLLVGSELYADTEGIITVWHLSPTRSFVVMADFLVEAKFDMR